MDKSQEEKEKLQTTEDIVKYIKKETSNTSDITYREVSVLDETIYLVFSEPMTSSSDISDFVIRSIKDIIKANEESNKLTKINNNIDEYIDDGLEVEKKRKIKINRRNEKLIEKLNNNKYLANEIIDKLEENIAISKVKKIDITRDDIFYYIFSGFTCIIYNKDILVVETKGSLDRTISTPTVENTVKGPKDAFTENYQSNIGLIRKRIKSEKLVIEENKIGRRSKTKVGLAYIYDIARPDVINHIKEKLMSIDIDAILDSNYIMELIEEKGKTNFPTVISTERPDLVSNYLLQGRIALIVENSPFALVIPAFLDDFINNIEDNYQKSSDVTLTKFVRYIAFFITIFTPAIYIALTTYNQEAIPTELLISFVAQREGVPFPAFLEAFLMILSFEILREGDYRVPGASGSTLSIVGALILGDAAVSAGIVSPIMIIVIAITTISGLMFSDLNMLNALRHWRIIFLVLAAVSGLIGLGVATMLLFIKITSTTSFEKAFSYPVAPINIKGLMDKVIKRESTARSYQREQILTDNITKYKTNKEN